MPGIRANCPICMESLFDCRDDLDEIVPIATSDCGHVFHEPCLLGWYNHQARTWVEDQRNGRGRADSLTASEAPAECPSCRAECFADPETGRPSIHRLYMNFVSADEPTSSMAGSSPMRGNASGSGSGRPGAVAAAAAAAERRRKDGQQQVLGMARRARGLALEVDGLVEDLNAPEEEEEQEGVLRRAKVLVDDLTEQKAVEGIRRYVGGLTTSINKLRTAIETNPRVPDLLLQLEAKGHELDVAHTTYQRLEQSIPRHVEDALVKERRRSKREVEQAAAATSRVQAELDEKRVAHERSRESYQERMRVISEDLEQAKAEVVREQKERKVLMADVSSYKRRLLAQTTKLAERKSLKERLAQLKAENIELRSSVKRRPGPASSASPAKRPRRSGEDDMVHDSLEDERSSSPFYDAADDTVETSIEEISQAGFRHATSRAGPSRVRSVRTSETPLAVDMPSFHHADHSLDHVHPGSTGARAVRAHAHPTARKFDSSMFDDGLGSPKKSSKYFGATSAGAGAAAAGQTFKTNPFLSSKDSTDARKRLSDVVAKDTRRRGSASRMGRVAAEDGSDVEVLNLVDDSDDDAERIRPSKKLASHTPWLNLPPAPPRRPRPLSDSVGAPRLSPGGGESRKGAGDLAKSKETGPAAGQKVERNILQRLGVVDRTGRPVKTAASGAKSHRRA